MTAIKNCPFCGGRASQPASTSPSDERCGYNFVAYVECSACGVSTRTESNHDKGGWCNESIESAKARAVKKWNSRPQPEATKPAQDLSAAILAIPLPEIGGNFQQGFRTALRKAAALASSADALSAGDRVDVITDTQRMDFQQANPHMYFNVDKRGKRWRFGHFSNYPQDCYGSAREALDAAIQAQKDGHD